LFIHNYFKMKRLVLGLLGLSLGLLVSGSAISQEKGKLEFEKMQHSFGDINEEAGSVMATFNFKNTGKAPIILTKVQASCGCTTPEWTKEPVPPGGEGFVKASYNPRNRPGPFNKSITIWSNGQPELTVLKITGKVIPRPKGPEDFYPMAIGNLRFKTTHVVFGDVMHDGQDQATTEVYNSGAKTLNLLVDDTQLPPHITMEASQTSLAPQETATLSFSYDATKKHDWGYQFDYFQLMTDDSERPEKRINISANIKENFGDMAEGEPMPKVSFDKVKHDFGDIEKGSRVTTEFKLTNQGKAPLIIRKTKASCGCTASRPDKMQLAPGETTSIKVTFNSGSRTGTQRKTITVICNDPEQSSTTLWIEANIPNAPAQTGDSGK